MVATEIFGPMGTGWGVDNEKFKEVMVGTNLWIIYTAKLWYKDPLTEKIGEISLASDIQFKSDAIKSVSTDALTKGLSQLGFNADVFLGDWDDNKYKNQQGGGFPSALPPVKSGSSFLNQTMHTQALRSLLILQIGEPLALVLANIKIQPGKKFQATIYIGYRKMEQMHPKKTLQES